MQVTISTTDGETITSHDPGALVQQVRAWLAPTTAADREALARLRAHLEAGHMYMAGSVAYSLELNFACAEFEFAQYRVPEDPADATICEACS
jgi:hypothetical protein